MKTTTDRRDFLKFLGRAGVVSAGVASGIAPLVSACEPAKASLLAQMKPLAPSIQDALILVEGLKGQVMLRWEDELGPSMKFGSHADFTAYHPLSPDSPRDGILWVNHEYLNPMLTHRANKEEKTKEEIAREMQEVGGSLVRVRQQANGNWEVVQNDAYNRRLDAHTRIPFAWPEPIAGASEAIGTMANCAGGITPWGTILTCEENYDNFWGERLHGETELAYASEYGWEKHDPRPPEHYGWVVEVNPKTGEAKKLVALGRCMHEAATLSVDDTGRVVAYTGDDARGEHLYKFIGEEPNSLEEGKLYVANLEKGEWVSLQWDEQVILQETFANQTEVQVHLRKAAKLVGATPLDRPEDIEIDPKTGAVLVALTNNTDRGNYHGQILKITEGQTDKRGLTFQAETHLAGGPEWNFSCPDNMAFDHQGNLWFTTDISGSKIGKGEYEPYGNNSLFVMPTSGDRAGEVLRVANAPMDAEFTGPSFSADGKTLFLCVQHPGETSQSMEALTSHWPDGGDAIPRSSVLAITGPLLEELSLGSV